MWWEPLGGRLFPEGMGLTYKWPAVGLRFIWAEVWAEVHIPRERFKGGSESIRVSIGRWIE